MNNVIISGPTASRSRLQVSSHLCLSTSFSLFHRLLASVVLLCLVLFISLTFLIPSLVPSFSLIISHSCLTLRFLCSHLSLSLYSLFLSVFLSCVSTSFHSLIAFPCLFCLLLLASLSVLRAHRHDMFISSTNCIVGCPGNTGSSCKDPNGS